jgi:hypothetical protein
VNTVPNVAFEVYKILVQLLKQEDILFWRRNEIMLVINGGMLAIEGWFQSSEAPAVTIPTKAISLAICMTGLSVCVLWMLIVKRSRIFYNHWYKHLRLLEKRYLEPVNIFQNADRSYKRGETKLGEEVFKLDFLSRRMRMFQVIQLVFLILAVAWVNLGILSFSIRIGTLDHLPFRW